ncbi:MAG TPA: hypothetical protein VHL79_11225 [Ramlibacter sp.]|jgi:hypothetical protein|nr:hypothetical protein [Ramlibacter sp.]
MEHSFDDQWRSEDHESASLLQKLGALVALGLASAGFVATVIWPLVAN